MSHYFLQADLSVTGHHEPAKVSFDWSTCPNCFRLLEDFEGELGAHSHGEAVDGGRNAAKVGFVLEYSFKFLPCSDILDVAKAGIEFFEHQRELEVTPL